MSLALTSLSATAAITDGAFSVNQIFDVQYNWSGTTLNASNFIAPYDSSFQTVVPTTGQYFKFIDNGNGTHGLGLYNSDGTLARTIHNTGQITALGGGAIFYIGSGFFGNVITPSQGYSYGDSASFTNMDTSVSAGDLTGYTWASTTPLASGQSAGAASSPNFTAVTTAIVTNVTPTSTNSPAGETANKAIDGSSGSKYLNFDRANAGFTITLNQGRVISGVKFTTANDFEPRDPTKFTLYGSNDGVTWTEITANQSTTLNTVSSRFTQTAMVSVNNSNPYVYYFITFPSIKAIDTYGSVAGCQAALGTLACDSVQIGEVTYFYDSNNSATSTASGTGTIANPGTPGAVSSMNTAPTVVSTAPGTSQVVVTETPGTTQTATANTRGTTQTVTAYANARGDKTADGKQMAVVRTTTVTRTTPITTTVTQTTPVTVTTVTTPRTVTTWSDGTTTTADDTPMTTTAIRNDITVTATVANEVIVNSTNQNYYTRVDQVSQLTASNTRMNMNLDSDLLNRHTSTGQGLTSRTLNPGSQDKGWWYLTAEGSRTSTADTYSMKGHRVGIGHERQIRPNWIIGLQYNRVEDKMTGENAGGTMIKDHVGVFSLYNYNNWLLKTDLATANNKFTNYHSLPELGYSNQGSMTGRDYWLSNRLYTPDVKGFRPFAGVRWEMNNRSAMTETGDSITAQSWDSVKQKHTVKELGLRYDVVVKDTLNFMAEASRTDSDINTVRAGINFTPKQQVIGALTVGQQRHNGITQNTAQAKLVLLF